MTMRRFIWIFVAIGIGALLLAAAGQWLLHWPDDMVGIWTGIGVAYILSGLVLRLLPRWWRQHCDEMYAMPAQKAYIRAIGPIMVAYALSLFASIWLIRQGIASLPLRALVALLPVLPLLLFLRAAMHYLRDIDELQRRIETEAIGIASLLVSMLYFGGGLLQKAKVIDIEAAAAMIWVFPLLCAIYGIAKMRLTKRYL